MSSPGSMKPGLADPASPMDRKAIWGLAAVFFGLAVGFLLAPSGSSIPAQALPEVSPEDIDPKSFRQVLGDPPTAMINGFKRTCMDCHISIDSEPRSEGLHQHANIRLQHGLNATCVNCHDAKDRNKLVTRDGKKLGYVDVALLCAQCHGPVYRQWQQRTHGKTLGYWDPNLGESRQLKCTECHDPHHPHFDPVKPLPGPNTLRMGAQDSESGHQHHEGPNNPLLIPRKAKQTTPEDPPDEQP